MKVTRMLELPVRSSLYTLVIALFMTAQGEAKEGFGFTKKTTQLKRITPPDVFVVGANLEIEAASNVDSLSEGVQRLVELLEAQLINADKRFRVGLANPDTRISVTVLESRGSEHWEDRKMIAKTLSVGGVRGKVSYQEREVIVRYQIVQHVFTASYKIMDLRENVSLAADTIRVTFNQEYEDGRGSPAQFALVNNAVDSVVSEIVRRVTQGQTVVGVLLPKGSLEGLASLAAGGQWNRYLETLEAMPALPNALEDTYRLYAIGTAYEALGYASKDVDSSLRYLERADVLYSRAIDANPGEKLFLVPYDPALSPQQADAPLQRVRAALVDYRKIKEFQDRSALALAKSAAEEVVEAAAMDDANVGMRNATVIQMVHAGLPDEVIMNAIDSAPGHEFDLSPDGLIRLSEGKVGKAIILHIQKLASAGRTAAKSAP